MMKKRKLILALVMGIFLFDGCSTSSVSCPKLYIPPCDYFNLEVRSVGSYVKIKKSDFKVFLYKAKRCKRIYKKLEREIYEYNKRFAKKGK